MSAIAKNFGKLCIKGEKDFNSVPDKWKAETRQYIESQGYIVDSEGNITKAN